MGKGHMDFDDFKELNKERIEKWKEEIKKKDPHAFKSHSFKKGQYLKSKQMGDFAKVLATEEYSVLVRFLSFKSIPRTLKPEVYEKWEVVDKKVYYKFKLKKVAAAVCGWIVSQGCKIQRKYNLDHTTKPKTKKDYLSNWVAFGVTLASRIQSFIWLGNEKNTFKGLTAHGPLVPKLLSKRK